MAFIPHSPDDIQAMLQTIGADDVEALFDEIPSSLRAEIRDHQRVPAAINEQQAHRLFNDLANQDLTNQCYIGAGAYEHHIPAAVWDITSRGEFMTAYTPYQAEASQGTLQLIYEYQTMMASLMGLEVSNASMYDGATALAESILMAIRLNRKSKSKKVLIPGALQPSYKRTLQTILSNQNIELVELPFATDTGKTALDSFKAFAAEDITAVVIAQPNFFGVIEEVDAITQWAHDHNALVIGCVNPMAMALLKEPGAWGEQGVDIACGSGQPFGVPLASGGPYFGFMCCKQQHVRQMPGRIVGATTDTKGRKGYTLTLQAREQHIRRGKATSNICTNQGLLVTAATIYLSLMGPEGLRKVAGVSHHQTKQLVQRLENSLGITCLFQTPFFHEVVLPLEVPAADVLAGLATKGIQGGFDVSHDFPELGQAILVCVTETKTEEDLSHYVKCLGEVLTELNVKKSSAKPLAASISK